MKTLSRIKPLMKTSIFVFLALCFMACSNDDFSEEDIMEEEVVI